MAMTLPSRLPLFAVWAILAAAGQAQQTGAPRAGDASNDPAQTYRAEARVVPVDAAVTDTSGHFVRHLTKDDFEVRDNGKIQPLTVFTPDVEPITAIVLLDASRSVVKGVETVMAAADQFVVRLRPGDRAKVGSFSDEIRLNPSFTGDRDALSRQVNNPFDLRLGVVTRLWDAIEEAIASFTDEDHRRVVIVFTDGDDTWSTNTFDFVLSHAHEAGVRLYIVLIEGLDRVPEERRGGVAPDFTDLAFRTGGGYYRMPASADLNTVATRMTEELHSSYLLGFAPKVLDGTRHRLSVTVKRPGVLVRARRHYLATMMGVVEGR
jgi:Ca-activated chloride channel family protein